MKHISVLLLALALALPAAAQTSDPTVLKFRIGGFSTRDGMPSYRQLGLERTAAVKSGEDAYYLVQFAGPVTDAWHDQVAKAGGKVFDYIPNYAHVVKMSPEVKAAVGKIPGVVFTGYYQPAFRIDPGLLGPQTPQSIEEPGRIMLNVLTFEVADRTVVRDRLLAANAGVRFLQEDEGGRIFQVSILADQAVDISKTIANYPEVRWVERYCQPVLNNCWGRWISQSRDTTGMGSGATTWKAKLRIKSADDSLKMPIYAHGLYGQGQIVGDDDTGLDWDNVYFRDPSLKPQYDKNADTVYNIAYNGHRKIVGYNVLADTFDLNSSGHGTHTNGSIAGDSMGSTHSGALSDTVLARAMGMAPMAKLAFTDVGNSSDQLTGIPANFANIYRWEYNAGARITSSSWGSAMVGASSYTANCEQLDSMAWSHKDIIMFRSAGNDNDAADNAANYGAAYNYADSVNTPATAKNIVCVGANESGFGATGTTWSNPGLNDAYNELKDLAEFSSHGPTKEGMRRPHLLTQGGWYIWSADADGNLSSNNSGITYMGGTSMACPAAAGLCALVRQYLTEGWYPTGVKTPANAIASPSGALMKAMMILSTRNSPGAWSTSTLNSNGTANVPSQGQGWGSVTLKDALYFSGNARKLRMIDVSPGFSASGQSASYTITTGASVDTMNPFKVVLVYYDYPSALAPSDISVNNLNLTVTIGGNTYLGNVFGANGKSATGGNADTLNPEEVVWLLPAAAKSNQTATITVTAASINHGPQPYALVAGGDIASSTGFPLAVSFSFMTVEQNGESVVLKWRTESERDCYRWEIQRSRYADRDYAPIGSLDGHGTVSTPTDYRFIDRNNLEAGTYYYKLQEIDVNGAQTEYGPIVCMYGGKNLPGAYELEQAMPNPARNGTVIRYALKNAGLTSLKVYNVLGQEVRTLCSGYQLPDRYSVRWDGRDDHNRAVANGIYFYNLVSGDYRCGKRMTVIK